MEEGDAAHIAELAAENAELKRSLAATAALFSAEAGKEQEKVTVTVQDPALVAELAQVVHIVIVVVVIVEELGHRASGLDLAEQGCRVTSLTGDLTYSSSHYSVALLG